MHDSPASQDLGRQACYRAEQKAFGADRFGGAIFSPDELRAALAEIHRAHGDGKELPTLEFPANRKGGGVAYGWRRLICLPPRGTTLVVLCHELAHVYTVRDVGHGPAWRREFVRLVSAAIGAKEAARLVECFASERVPVDATKSTRAYKARTRKNRKFRLEISHVDVSRAVSKTVGNVTTWSGIEWGPWQPCEKSHKLVSGMSTSDYNAMRNGCVWFRGSVRLPGPEGNCGNSYSAAKVRLARVR